MAELGTRQPGGQIRPVRSEPVIGAVDVHRAALGASRGPFQHRLEIWNKGGYRRPSEADEMGGPDRRRSIDPHQRPIIPVAVDRSFRKTVPTVKDVGILGIQHVECGRKQDIEPRAEIAIVFEKQDAPVSGIAGVAENGEVAEEAAARSDIGEAGRVRRTDRRKQDDAGIVKARTDAGKFAGYLGSSITTVGQVEDIDLIEAREEPLGRAHA